jgi:phosphoribosyl 1,2-cyclic phosphodiesterase
MQIKFWGTRGSIPVPGKATLKYGGNTPCVEVRSQSGKLIILDAGSGIRELGNKLVEENFKGDIDIFISHYHWDHIQGLPFFKPFYDENISIKFYGIQSNGMNVENVLRNQMMPNNFPVNLEEVNSKKEYLDIFNKTKYNIDTISIETFLSNHPSPTLVFKLTENGKHIVYVTDNELCVNPTDDTEGISAENKDMVDFCRNADYLVHDVMYDENSFKKRKGWGHSGNLSVAHFSIAAEVKNLVFFHYNPDYTDKKIDSLVNEVQEIFHREKKEINCIASSEGLVLDI